MAESNQMMNPYLPDYAIEARNQASAPPPRKKRVLDGPALRERVANMVAGYDCEHDHPHRVAENIIRLVRRNT